MKIPSLVEMLQAGVHFGHQTSRWHPKMKEYIYCERSGVHVIDLEKTRAMLEETLKAVQQMAAEGKQILFISTKPQAKAVVQAAAERCGMPYLVDRWIGGLLTNFAELKKLIKKYLTLKEQQDSGELERYTKKEQLDIARQIEKMDGSLAGLVSLTNMPDALFIPALQKEKTAVTEARKKNIPIVAICDTNSNPDHAAHVIPANDDAVKSIEMMVGLVADAVAAGRKEWDKKQATQKAAAEKKDEKKDAPAAESK